MLHLSRLAPILCIAGGLSAAVACSSSSVNPDDTDAGPGGGGTDSGLNDETSSMGDGGALDEQSASDSPSTMGCGTCPTGSTCGSANGLPVCRSASGIPIFSHVFVIMMENTSKSSLDAAPTPYLKSLGKSWATGSDYHGTSHPSLPNYLALTSGNDQGLKCDCDPVGSACTVCTFVAFPSGCGCNQAVTHVGDQLDSAGKTWKAYGDGMGTACNTVNAGAYATRHVPFLYYDNMQPGDAGARCTSHVVPYTGFAADLAGTPSQFSYIAPDLNHDMHGTGTSQTAADITAGDTWLSTNAKAILDSAAFKAGGLLVIVWDEDDGSGGITGSDVPVPIYVMSPYAKTVASTGYVSAVNGNHYSLLATIEDGMGLPRLGGAIGKNPLADYFPAN